MAVIEWNDRLAIDDGVMDETHREFVDLVNRMADAPDEQMEAIVDEFIRHTEEHFGQEERWMRSLSFPPLGCHKREHDGVLEIAREVKQRIARGEIRFGRVLAQAVAEWFADHAASMDTVLSMYMKDQGYTPTVGALETTEQAD
ncbi:MAG: bacteriohemerythrin [Betaproteobacteria bacterium]|nr:bacteriohemerythrin [Betaproteobacteria bacterium]